MPNFLTFISTKSVCNVFKPKRFKLHCPTLILNGVPMEYVTNVKYLGFMFTSERMTLICKRNKQQLTHAITQSCVKMLFRKFCTSYYGPYLIVRYEETLY